MKGIAEMIGRGISAMTKGMDAMMNSFSSSAGECEGNFCKQPAGSEVEARQQAAGSEAEARQQAAGSEAEARQQAAGSEAEARQQAAGSEAEARQQAAGSETEARLQPAGNETYARRRSRRSDLFGGKKRAGGKNAAPDKGVRFAEEVLDDFRKNVGRFRAETGGMLASRRDPRLIDVCHFDTYSENTTGTFYYDVESMSKVYREWKRLGYTTNGIYHSHPLGATRPSFHDISSALLHLRFFDLDYFYLPIFQNDRKGLYTMYFYVVRKQGEVLEVNLDYVLKANEEGYSYSPFARWKQVYPIRELDAYRDEINRSEESEEMKEDEEMKNTEAKNLSEAVSPAEDAAVSGAMADTAPYFDKVKDLYPPHVLDKVIISVGTGGARSALTNFARCGFKNFILIEADIVSESNIATQAVHISEIGRKKTEVIREEILDINPNAVVVCVDRFLDDSMSDEEFKGYMDLFPGKKPTDYLILGCTDNFEAQKRSSILALKYGTPYLAAMMYKSGAAAELIFVYPGVTESCPRCLLGSRFEKYENGFENDVDSSACPIFATERMNALKGYIALMLLMYHEAPGSIYDEMLDSVKDRNFVQIRLTPNVRDTLGISIFDRAFEQAKRYTFMDETVWIPQKPDHPSNGYAPCRLCGGTGHLEQLYMKWEDTRKDFTLIRP